MSARWVRWGMKVCDTRAIGGRGTLCVRRTTLQENGQDCGRFVEFVFIRIPFVFAFPTWLVTTRDTFPERLCHSSSSSPQPDSFHHSNPTPFITVLECFRSPCRECLEAIDLFRYGAEQIVHNAVLRLSTQSGGQRRGVPEITPGDEVELGPPDTGV